jgi:hypothetical protein
MSVNFKARVDNGTINIPEEYRARVKGNVRVTISDDDGVEASAAQDNIIEELLAHPLNVPGFQPLSRDEIYSRD